MLLILLQLIKFILDTLPLVLFFIFYKTDGIFAATSTLVFSSILCMALRWAIFKHVPAMAVVGTILLCVFGGLTIYFNNSMFIKIKPTIVYSLFSMVLILCVIFNKNALSFISGGALKLPAKDWKKICLFFALVFLTCALLNELVWRNFSDDTWVSFKVIVFPLINITAFLISYFIFLRKALSN